MVPAILPLSLLEAVQNIDTPPDDGLGALQPELAAKRLGLSPTVAAQIARYRAHVSSDDAVSDDEALAVFRLVGRRPDAALVYADAGRRAARYASRRVSAPARAFLAALPGRFGREAGLKSASRLAQRWLLANLQPGTDAARCEMEDSLARRGRDDGVGCQFYTAAIGELLRVVARLEWPVLHERCTSQGDRSCLWRAAPAEAYE